MSEETIIEILKIIGSMTVINFVAWFLAHWASRDKDKKKELE